MTKKIAILFSGNGSNLESIIKTLHQKSFKKGALELNEIPEGAIIGGLEEGFILSQDKDALKVEVALALSNNANAYGIQRAKNLGVDTQILPSKNYPSRESFDKELVAILKPLNLDLCVLAGFMRILTPYFINSIPSINLHPSLLPLFIGANGIEESLNSPMKLGGISIHHVSEELDNGELITQGVLKKQKESLESYATRIHRLEHFLYPLTILKVLYGN